MKKNIRHKNFSRKSFGFSLIELMIGLVIGLISTLAITQILLNSEGQKRTASSGSDAQISAVVAISNLRQFVQMSGYGFASAVDAIGCPIEAVYSGVPVSSGFPSVLVPFQIIDGASGASDTIRILSSSKTSFSIPIGVIAPGYLPTTPGFTTNFPVTSVRGILKDDLVLAVNDSKTRCQMFQVTDDSGGSSIVDRSDDSSRWNQTGFPNIDILDGGYLINMGSINDVTYSVSALGTLQSNSFVLGQNASPGYTGFVDIFDHIVNMQAYYGKDTDDNGSVDLWDTINPVTNAQWRQVISVRLALVSQSDQYEKADELGRYVTQSDPLWDVGLNSTISGAQACGSSKCISLKVSHITNWRNYRYKVVDTVIPLKNMIWRS